MKAISKASYILFSILFLLALPFVVLHIKFVYPVDSFCRDIQNDEKREQIMLAGKAKGFLVWEWSGEETLWILNHNDGTIFRVACEVRFKDGKPLEKVTVIAD
jgi:hypothetical protein